MAEKGFYLIDTESQNYFVGQIFRTDDQIKDFLKNLKVGETYWSSKTQGFERFR